MCGRYVSPEQAAIERFWHIGRHNWLQRFLEVFNVAPTSTVPVIIRGDDGVLELNGARWGLVPHWWKNDALPAMTFNARSEEAAQKPTWRQSLKTQRCLMPVRGWYEWSEMELEGRKFKQPYFLHAAGDDVIAFAGLWATWRRPETEPVLSCALLTRAASASVAHIHHRMPVVLKPEYFDEWLDPATSPQRIQEIIADARTDFEGYAVSTRVNNARNNSPELLHPLPRAV
jgi:putative SOS response-associated peptidase YedK